MGTKQGRLASLAAISPFLLSGCLGGLWTSASLIYDRHNVYKKVADYQLIGASTRVIYADNTFKTPGSAIDITVFRNVILLAGHVPTETLREEAQKRVASVCKNSRIYNELRVSGAAPNTLQDSWITAKIRTKILADSSIDPNAIKVTTSDSIVYLLGEMKADEASKVIKIARNIVGVQKVVKILQYYTYLRTDRTA